MTTRILSVIAALVLPVLWGVLINWIFDLWQGDQDQGSDRIFPDYQI